MEGRKSLYLGECIVEGRAVFIESCLHCGEAQTPREELLRVGPRAAVGCVNCDQQHTNH